jgi:hypothetical protein
VLLCSLTLVISNSVLRYDLKKYCKFQKKSSKHIIIKQSRNWSICNSFCCQLSVHIVFQTMFLVPSYIWSGCLYPCVSVWCSHLFLIYLISCFLQNIFVSHTETFCICYFHNTFLSSVSAIDLL